MDSDLEPELLKGDREKSSGRFKIPPLEHVIHSTVLGFYRRMKFRDLHRIYSKLIFATDNNYKSGLTEVDVHVDVGEVTILDHSGITAYASVRKNRRKKLLDYSIRFKTSDRCFTLKLTPLHHLSLDKIGIDTTKAIVILKPEKEFYSFEEVKRYTSLCDAIKKI